MARRANSVTSIMYRASSGTVRLLLEEPVRREQRCCPGHDSPTPILLVVPEGRTDRVRLTVGDERYRGERGERGQGDGDGGGFHFCCLDLFLAFILAQTLQCLSFFFS